MYTNKGNIQCQQIIVTVHCFFQPANRYRKSANCHTLRNGHAGKISVRSSLSNKTENFFEWSLKTVSQISHVSWPRSADCEGSRIRTRDIRQHINVYTFLKSAWFADQSAFPLTFSLSAIFCCLLHSSCWQFTVSAISGLVINGIH
jgi:hypothetical protein